MAFSEYMNFNNSNIELTGMVDTNPIKCETFVDVSKIKTEEFDFSVDESNVEIQIKEENVDFEDDDQDPIEISDNVNKCDSCSDVFATKSRLFQHIFSFHEEYALQCNFCDEIFAKKANLDEHIKGSLISEGIIFNLSPSSKKYLKSLSLHFRLKS